MNPACDRCHRRKSRCDKAVPSCGPCRKAGVACKYVNHTRDRQKALERLQRRIQQLEGENRLLTERLGNHRPTESDSVSHRPPEPIETVQERDALSNELTEEISFLSSRAGGENQFLGSTSGVLLASLVDATVHAPSGPRVESRPIASPLNGITPSTAVDVSPVPDERVARALHDAYFEHDHVPYPFLHRATALAILDKTYQDVSFAQDAFSCYSFNMILAIATASVYKFDRESLPDAETYHLRAAERLNEVLQRGDTQALQAMLLLCQYRMVNSVQDTSTSMWHLVGVAARMCLELGLHREQVYQVPKHRGDSSVVVAHEIRRRCFWSVIAMDRIVSITLGRPLAIRLQDTDVALPNPSLDSLLNDTASDLCITALFIHIVRYRVICGDIMSALHTGSTRTQTDAESALRARDNLANTLAQWHADTANLSLEDEPSSQPQHQSSFRTPEWYAMLYYNALLMLYRPSPALSGISMRDPTVLQSIFVAAKQAITIYAQLHRWKRINYTWITLHAVFMAGLSYVYAVGRHFRSHKRKQGSTSTPVAFLESDPAIIDIVNDCRTCSNVLVAISERWNLAKNCYDVFNRLSDAVLTDAVEYHTKPSSSQTPTRLPIETADMTWDNGFNGPLAVDSVLRDCLDDLQHFQPSAYGDDPVGQLSHDWMGEIEGMGFNLFL
ncbi:hypothetical protein ASPVEDRAFT_34701 [Aspergillus versicolor CBS 583.65]|uniref:Zn(2)-C6 fungal-type domain-containing protein n=1 Tax=Aspergillus versicolor CBS 583.65 TaxID=1036611 RepID=A0A1L9Q4A3_ASPVE|nr:uncharacterized protein ASPVEDRAFT_34701 [Aspergillus versicolor CBS 583.65]OJJ08559.1 hypothetical protein ASPVEDRAFT_34701 [Aspergillus versicolor CBS 583.65]